MRPLTAEYGKLHSRIAHLYDCDCPDCVSSRTVLKRGENGDKIPFDIFRRAYRRVFDRRGMSPEMLSEKPIAEAIEATASVLREAAAPALESAVVPPEMRRALSEDIFVFSGFKTYHNLKEASALLLDEDGKIKPFGRYLQDIRGIHERYNKSYLEAEYLFATQSARMADKWQEHAQDEDRYNLQYRTAGDARVRQEHQALDLVTLPASDPFWAEYYPPNGWRCRCNVVRVRKGKYEESNSARAIEAGRSATEDKLRIFRFNPGRQKVIFPPHHPYYGRQGSREAEAVRGKLEEINGKPLRSALTPEQKEHRKAIEKEAVGRLRGRSVSVPGAPGPITFTRKGIREFLNQPHEQYFEKNEAARGLDTLVQTAEWLGEVRPKGDERSFIARVTIGGRVSFLIFKKMPGNPLTLHSISDADMTPYLIEKPD